MLRATPNRRAIASPASTASTTGSTKSSEMTTKNNCVETEVMMLGSSRLSPDLEGWRFQRKDVRVERIRLETAPSRSWGAEAKRCHVTEPSWKRPLEEWRRGRGLRTTLPTIPAADGSPGRAPGWGRDGRAVRATSRSERAGRPLAAAQRVTGEVV